jgi:hypothetical protein
MTVEGIGCAKYFFRELCDIKQRVNYLPIRAVVVHVE